MISDVSFLNKHTLMEGVHDFFPSSFKHTKLKLTTSILNNGRTVHLHEVPVGLFMTQWLGLWTAYWEGSEIKS